MRRGAGDHPPFALAVPAAIALLFIALPLGGLLVQVSWRDLPAEVASDDVRTALRLSLECSLLAVAVSVVLGVPLAYVLARTRVPGKRVVRALVVLPLVLPPVVGGIALQSVFGRSTFVGRVLQDGLGVTLPFTTAGAVVAETFVAFPFLVLTVEAGLRQADTGFEDAAATLGAGPWRRFWRVTLPVVSPSLLAGAALCWARALGEFGATITFAGSFPGTTQTLPIAAYTAFEGSGDTQRAVTLSFLLLAISLAILVGLRDRWLGAPG